MKYNERDLYVIKTDEGHWGLRWWNSSTFMPISESTARSLKPMDEIARWRSLEKWMRLLENEGAKTSDERKALSTYNEWRHVCCHCGVVMPTKPSCSEPDEAGAQQRGWEISEEGWECEHCTGNGCLFVDEIARFT